MPLISVIIPTCNGRARFVDQALASVAAQTFQDFELIIVDDASTDGTLEYIQDLMPKIMAARPDTPIVYAQRETNGGEPVARNDGANRANGELLAFLDQDDLWEPTFLEESLRLLQEMRNTACVHTDGRIINVKNDVVRYSRNLILPPTQDLCHLLTKGRQLILDGCLFRKTHFDAVNGFDEKLRIWTDRDFAIRFSRHYGIIHLPKPLYRSRMYGRSACGSTVPELAYASRTYFLEKHAPSCRHDPRLRKALQYEWSMLYSDMGKYHLSQNQRKTARSLFRQSLRSFPFSRRTWLRYLRSYRPSFSPTRR